MALSQIQEFYKNQSVFITGSTGLLGKLVLRKLLISCDVKKIFLLIRQNKGKSAEERLDALLDSSCYQNLGLDKVDLRRKIFIIGGDCVLPGLGISQEDRTVLVNETTCIVHIAATVRFNEVLRTAAYINVRAVQDVLRLAKEATSLRAMVYVSTAFSNCNQKYLIKEQFYDPPMKAEGFLKLLELVNDETLSNITSGLLGSWPNNYTFTKALAENIVKEEGENLPISIVRPAILNGSYQEPQPGWLDAIQGNTAFFMGVGLGLIHCHMGHYNTAALVPSDYAVNTILSSAWYSSVSGTKTTIFHFAGSRNNALTGRMLHTYGSKVAQLYPSIHAVSAYFVVVTRNEYFLRFCQFWFHLVPAYTADLVFLCLGRERQVVKMYQKFHRISKMVQFFTVNWWDFESTNTETLWAALNDKDKELFPFNMEELDWKRYFEDCMLYGRVHILKDPLETLPQARRRQIYLKLFFYFILFVVGCGLLCLFYFILFCFGVV